VLGSTITTSGTLTLDPTATPLVVAPIVTLHLKDPSGSVRPPIYVNAVKVSDTVWNYSDSTWQPDTAGVWDVYTTWDEATTYYYKDMKSLTTEHPTVASAVADFTLDPIVSPIQFGASLNITGALTENPSHPIITKPDINITLTPPSGKGSPVTRKATITSLESPWTYRLPWVFSSEGTWTVSAAWAGNSDYSEVSKSISVTVSSMAPKQLTGGQIEMIALPVWPSYASDPTAELTLSPGTDFSLAAWITSSGVYKIWSSTSGGSGFPDLAPGLGLWIKTVGNTTMTPKGSVVDPTQDFGPIQLKSGWNLIGNPYLADIDWANMQISYQNQTLDISTAADRKWVLGYGYIWVIREGETEYRYHPVTNRTDNEVADGLLKSIPSWHGCWVKALIDCQLYVKAPAGSITSAVTSMAVKTASSESAKAGAASSATKWTVRIGAANGERNDDKNYFGVNSKKAESMECPAYPSGYVDLYFTNSTGTARYIYDVKSSEKAGQSWRFKVHAVTPGDVMLTWDGLESVTSGVKLLLIDEATGVSQEMVTGGSYTYSWNAVDAERAFKIVIADK